MSTYVIVLIYNSTQLVQFNDFNRPTGPALRLLSHLKDDPQQSWSSPLLKNLNLLSMMAMLICSELRPDTILISNALPQEKNEVLTLHS